LRGQWESGGVDCFCRLANSVVGGFSAQFGQRLFLDAEADDEVT
jgi:hypothetical protein